MARERIEQVCDRAFEETFENDPSVFIVRQVHTKLAVLASHAAHDSRLAEQLGARLCASVVRVIASSSHTENVIRFENQATYVSGFLSDFVAGTAWGHWYHDAFGVYRDLPPNEAVLAVLVDNLDCLGEILHRLMVANSLVAILAALGPDGQRCLWLRFTRQTAEPPSEDAFRIFVHTAFHLVDSFSIWAAGRPTEQDFLRHYLLSHPANPRWADPSSLASAVIDVLRALFRGGRITAPHVFDSDDLARLDLALDTSCDWLDKPFLKKYLLSFLSPVLPPELVRSTTIRPPVLTPAQLRLLGSLLSAIRDRHCPLDPAEENPHAPLLRILAGLAGAESSANSATIPVIESIVAIWLMLYGNAHRDSILLNLRRGQFDIVLASVSAEQKAPFGPHLESVANAGEPAIAIIDELLKQYPPSRLVEPLKVLDSACAGLFLLVRTVQDLRLSALLKESGFDSLPPLLVALSVRIAGPPALQDGRLDPGAAVWSGIAAEEFPTFLSRLDNLDVHRFGENLSALLAAQRFIDPVSSLEFVDLPLSVGLSPQRSHLLDFTVSSLLRAWARWLPGLSGSSVPFLLEKFIRRSGTLYLYADRIDVTLSPGQLDAILKMAGYLSDSPVTSWLGNRFVRFRAAS